MPIFSYTAKISPQKTIDGSIEASSEQEAINKLIARGLFPISLTESLSILPQSKHFFKKISSNDTILFTHQLSTLINSGVVLLSALGAVAEQTRNLYLKSILNDIASQLKEGKSFSQALAKYNKIFSKFYISMIKAGEVSGKLDEALKRLEDSLQKDNELKSSIKDAMVYPAFIAIVGVITVFILLGFVIPNLMGIFTDMDEALPMPTQVLLFAAGFLKKFWWLIVSIIALICFTIMRKAQTKEGRMYFDRLKLKLPLISQVVPKIEISRFSRTLSTLISSGMPVSHSLEIASDVVNNSLIAEEIKKMRESINKGKSFSQTIKNAKFFPIFVMNIVSVGEETGTLDRSLNQVAEEYSKEIERIFKNFIRILEPAIILIMGLVVGFIIIAMLLPIFQINLAVK